MNRKKFSSQKTLLVFLITVIIFSIGVFVGSQNTYNKFNKVLDLSEKLQLQTAGVEVEFDILKDNICSSDNVLFLTEELFELSRKLDYMENTMGYDNPRIKELKDKYFILEAKHWLLAKKRANTCFQDRKDLDMNNTIILFFYSNEGDCPNCQRQGAVISYLHEKFGDMKVYSFDIKSETPVVNVIKKLYHLDESQLPALVINDEVHQGFLDSDALLSLVEKQSLQKLSSKISNQE